jgi:4-amino-4-deoxy-L-arabinose transferase-like glycosyltransferase
MIRKLIPIAAVLIFLVVAVGSSLTHRPQIDEGMFASPAYNLAFNGHFGTTVLETEKSSLTRIEERTYWVMPLFLLNASASFKLLGFSLFSMRLVSILWGLILLGSVFVIALQISRDRAIALMAMALAATDYMVLETASSGRMDMMSASLGFAAIAVYLLLRERNFVLAVLASHCLVVLDGLTHPNAILAFAALAFLTIFFDRQKLNLRLIFLISVPYLLGGAAFGIWVFQDPQAFKDQFIDNAMMGGRMSGFSSPIQNILREFTERYPHAYGLQDASSGHSGPIYLKGLILIGYAAGVVGMIAFAELRKDRRYLGLLAIAGIYFILLSLIDGQKQTTYLIQIVPLYLIFLAAVMKKLWERGVLPKPVVAAIVFVMIALPLGGMALKIKQNTYGNYYEPMIALLKERSSGTRSIMGGSELAFGLGFGTNHFADGRFGFYTGKRPDFIVYDSAVENSWRDSKKNFPEFYEYFPRLLEEQYSLVYENGAFKVYERKWPATAIHFPPTVFGSRSAPIRTPVTFRN